MIYADNAATTKMSGAAMNAMLNCMEETWGNPSSLYGLGQRAKEALEEARERIAACIGASPKEIIFTSDVEAILKAVPEIVGYLRNMSPLWKDKVSGKKEFVL